METLRVGLGEKGWVNFTDLHEALKKYAEGMDSLQEAKAKSEEAKKKKERLEELSAQREKELETVLQQIKDEEARRKIEEQHRLDEEERARKIQEEEQKIKEMDIARKELEDKLTDQLAEYAKAVGFIRKQATLRFNPVLDKVQDSIKFCNLFNDAVTIINGGPGTGKTTTMIQRLKLLICELDLQDYINIGECKLNKKQLNIISENGGNWIFFSPTELLKEYLKENMNYEGLQDTSNKVQVWNTYLQKILRDKYHLVGDNAPFSFRRKEHEGTVLIETDELDILDEFTAYFMNDIKRELEQVANLDVSKFSWKMLGKKIAEKCKDAQKANSLRDLYITLMNMEHFLSDRIFDNNNSIDNLIQNYYDEIHKIASLYMVEWKKNEKLYEQLLSIYHVDELEDNTSEEEDDDEFNASSVENKLALDLRHLLRLLTLQNLQEVEIIGRKAEILELTKDLIKTDELKQFADMAFFNKNVAPLIKGYAGFVIPLIPKSYKAFRKEQFDNEGKGRWNLKLLKKIVGGDNRPLHPQEQALMLGFINNFLLTIRNISLKRFEELTDERKGHRYGKAFNAVCCSVIGIDEATDYCMLDFYAINSLRHYEVSSITMTGDGMQCLKENGIFSWDALKDKRLFSKVDVKNLNISYRQSKELLRLAQSLYRKTLHKVAPYKCYFEDMDNVPKPLWYENDEDERKAKWIVQRVLEIKENYGFMPSIAIFVSNQKDAEFLEEYITEQGKLDEAGIEIKNCVEGDKLAASDTVRIFPIEKVKGMEFEVVFFHNIDKLSSLVERFLYVGLSRATFYMGVTSDPVEDSTMLQIQKMFNKRGNWKTLVQEDINDKASR